MNYDSLITHLRQIAQDEDYDLLEEFHSASKSYKNVGTWNSEGWKFANFNPLAHEVRKAAVKRRNGHPPISLPPRIELSTSLSLLRQSRRSVRRFSPTPITLEQLATVLDYGYGFCRDGRRAVPSGGGLYPLELFVIASRVSSLKSGLYHYLPEQHAIEDCRRDADQDSLQRILAPTWLEDGAMPAVHVVVTAVFPRTTYKYGLRGYRLATLEAGHVVHAMALASEGLKLGSCPNLAYYDVEMDDYLEIDGVTESAVYLLSIGAVE